MNNSKALTVCLGLSLLANALLLQKLNNKNPTETASVPLTPSTPPEAQPSSNSTKQLLNQLTQNLLKANDCLSAASYQAHQQDSKLSPEQLEQWLDVIKLHIQQHQLTSASTCLNAILDVYPYNASLNWQLGELYQSHEQHDDALITFYNALPMSTDKAWVAAHKEKFHQAIQARYQQLKEKNDWASIQEYFSQVLSLEDGNVFYQLIYAESLFEIEQYDESKQWLLPITTDPEFGLRAQQLLAKIESRNMPNIAVPLQSIGEQYLVSLTIDNQPTTLLIDTGASISLLKESKYQQLLSHTAPSFIRETSLQTAGGVISAPVYRFEALQLAEIKHKNPQFVVVELAEMQQFDGLLGMDFFKSFHFVIDQQNSQLLLSPIDTTFVAPD